MVCLLVLGLCLGPLLVVGEWATVMMPVRSLGGSPGFKADLAPAQAEPNSDREIPLQVPIYEKNNWFGKEGK